MESAVAVYVDEPIHPFGRMMMCHMWADTEAELFAMADKIGVARKWVQGHATSIGHGRKASWLHFDIAKGKRSQAVKHGAIECDRYECAAHVARLRGNTKMLDKIEKVRARRAG